MCWGNPSLDYVRLNKDMISYSGGINAVQNLQLQLPSHGRGPLALQAQRHLHPAPRRQLLPRKHSLRHRPVRHQALDLPRHCHGHPGCLLHPQPAVIVYKGGDYFFYHNGALPGGSGYQRSIAIEKFD
jgi:arabinoxylan arabinofuranohydrolase